MIYCLYVWTLSIKSFEKRNKTSEISMGFKRHKCSAIRRMISSLCSVQIRPTFFCLLKDSFLEIWPNEVTVDLQTYLPKRHIPEGAFERKSFIKKVKQKVETEFQVPQFEMFKKFGVSTMYVVSQNSYIYPHISCTYNVDLFSDCSQKYLSKKS